MSTISTAAHKMIVDLIKGCSNLEIDDMPILSGGREFVVVRNYRILFGQYIGQVVNLSIMVPQDYPLSAPSGFHVNKELAPIGQHAVHARQGEASGLEGPQQYWSRQAPRWDPAHRGKCLFLTWQTAFHFYGKQ